MRERWNTPHLERDKKLLDYGSVIMKYVREFTNPNHAEANKKSVIKCLDMIYGKGNYAVIGQPSCTKKRNESAGEINYIVSCVFEVFEAGLNFQKNRKEGKK